MNKFTVENLDLYYGDFKALKNINLNIAPNEITAFIGPSGCGKSTLLKSMNRMNDLVEGCKITGKMLLDNEDIYGDMDTNLLRKRVGMVFQKPNPFPMSIYDNIAYGPRTHGIRSRVRLDEIVEKSLRGAAIWDEVKDKLKKSALAMSGGQQQRIAIARAILKDAPIVVFDEATSYSDIENEHKIQLALQSLLKNKTTIMIAHRLHTIKNADNIVVFRDGKIAEQGRHEELEALGGIYSEMWHTYLGENGGMEEI